MRAPTMLQKKVTVHYAAVPVGARIARPRFVLDDWTVDKKLFSPSKGENSPFRK